MPEKLLPATNPTPVYICAPYSPLPDGPGTPERQIRFNVSRAQALAALATRQGFAPILPHGHNGAFIMAGEHLHRDRVRRLTSIYDGTEEALAKDRHESIERLAMDVCLAHVRMVRAAGGEIWVLHRDDGTLSRGCTQEVETFLERDHQRECRVARGTWEQWELSFKQVGMQYTVWHDLRHFPKLPDHRFACCATRTEVSQPQGFRAIFKIEYQGAGVFHLLASGTLLGTDRPNPVVRRTPITSCPWCGVTLTAPEGT